MNQCFPQSSVHIFFNLANCWRHPLSNDLSSVRQDEPLFPTVLASPKLSKGAFFSLHIFLIFQIAQGTRFPQSLIHPSLPKKLFSQYISKFRKLLKGLYSILLEKVNPCFPQSWLLTKGTIFFKLHIFPNFGNCSRHPQEIVLNSVKAVFPAVLTISKLAKSCYRPYFLALWNIFVSENSWRDPQQIVGTGFRVAGSPGWLTPRLANWCNLTY